MDHLPYGIKSSLFPCLKSKAFRIKQNYKKKEIVKTTCRTDVPQSSLKNV